MQETPSETLGRRRGVAGRSGGALAGGLPRTSPRRSHRPPHPQLKLFLDHQRAPRLMQTFSFTVWPAAGQGGGLHLPGAGLFPTATLQSPSEDPPDPPPCTGPQPVHLVHSSRPRGLSSPNLS